MKKINYYRLYNIFQNLYTFIPYHFGRGRSFQPLRYDIKLTFRCNLRCPFCFINGANHKELDTETWLNFIEKIPPFSLVSYSGGEVTLRADFKTILKKSLQKAKVTFLTNGTFMDDEIVDIIVNEKLFLLGVSIDGINDKHDSIRGVKGTFERAIANIEKIQQKRKKNKHPLIDIKTIIINENLDDIVDIYKLATSLNADVHSLSFLKGCNLQFNPVLEDDFSEKFHKHEYPVDKYFDVRKFEAVYKELLRLSEKSDTKLRFNPEFSHKRGEAELRRIKALFEQGRGKKIQDLYQDCLHPWAEMSVSSNGDCFPCLCYKTANIQDASLLKLWNNEKYVNFRKRLKKQGIFNSCQGCCFSKVKLD